MHGGDCVRRNRGFGLVDLAIIVGMALAVLGSLYGAYRHVDSKGYARGVAVTESAWQAREARQQADYSRELKRLGDHALEATQKGASDTAAAVHKLNKEHADELAQKDADFIALSTGKLVFHDPDGAACGAPGRSAKTAIAADTARDQPAESVGLSTKASGFLLSESARADALVADFNAALAILVSDREVCR